MTDVSDCTLIIPVRFDSQDRINNYLTVINFIKDDFPSFNILVCEHDKESKLPQTSYTKLTHKLISSSDMLFYKTKCINDAVKEITTKYFAIWDADILLKPDQILKTISLLREGYETVYPYDGTFLNVPKMYHQAIRFTNSVNSIYESQCIRGLGMPELTSDRQSFGGCVFFNKESFIKYGMANEKMISYGPEDAEIAYRFRLVSKYIRVNGPLYHLDHERTLNSTEEHTHASKNHEEFNKILKMDKNTLLEYVKTWTWNII